MVETLLRDSLTDIDPIADIRERGIKLLGLDVENVLTDYGNPEVLPGVAAHLEEIQTANDGLKMVLITNQKKADFLEHVLWQLPGGIRYIKPTPEIRIGKKPSADMFKYAIWNMYEGVMPGQMAHVDDQAKAWWGANGAGLGTFFWTLPAGEHQHLGVEAFRPVELGLIRPAVNLSKSLKEQ